MAVEDGVELLFEGGWWGGGVVQGHVGAEFAAERGVGGAGDGGDVGAPGVGQLDRRTADAAARADHEQPLAGAQAQGVP